MKKIVLNLGLFSILSVSMNAQDIPYTLPENFAVYTDGETLLNWQPSPQYEEINLPTFNFYQGDNGGYLAIYTRDEEPSVYSVGDGIYVMGQIRLEGHYEGRIFIPKGFNVGDDITQEKELLEICELYFPHMKGRMWVGADTGGWFGIQE